MFSVTSAMDVALFALAVVAVAVRTLDDAGSTLRVVMTVAVAVAGLGILDQVAEDEQNGADEERERLHREMELVRLSTNVLERLVINLFSSHNFILILSVVFTVRDHNAEWCDVERTLDPIYN